MAFVLTNIEQLLTLEGAYKKMGRNLLPSDLNIISKAAVLVNDNGLIEWVGAMENAPSFKGAKEFSMEGRVVTPELVDSHTHLVFGGDRSSEYAMRLNGADYQEIANAGGGILSTMRATLDEDEETLFQKSCKRIEAMAAMGVGTIEIKSGYALTYKGEKGLTDIITRLKKHFSPRIQIFNTFMAAHAVPKEYASSKEYLHKIVIPLLRDMAASGTLDAVDIFHEKGYFTDDDVRDLFKVADELKIAKKIHADEFGENGGAELAVEFNALSADHLLGTGESGIKALGDSETVATLLPGTGLFLGKANADAQKMTSQNVKIALATDYNPGSCHVNNLVLLASISAPLYGLNQAQIWSGITLNAAHALGLRSQGAICKGLKGRFSIFKTDTIDSITYCWGNNLSEGLRN